MLNLDIVVLLYQWCLFERVTVELTPLRKPLSTDADGVKLNTKIYLKTKNKYIFMYFNEL